MAREFGVMHMCDVMAPEPTETIVDALDGEMTCFRDSLKAGFRWPIHPFFINFLTSFFMCTGQLAPNGWMLLIYFFILCRCLRLDLLRMVFDMKFVPRYNCVYLSTNRGLGHLKP